VVLVDDLPEVRTMVRVALNVETDLTVVGEADTGAQGVEAVARLQPHVVILDLRLPDMAGRDAFRAIRSAAPHSRIIIYAGGDSDRRWYESQAALFIQKIGDIDNLLAAIRHGDPGLDN